jgi:hypothetical protein
MKNIFDLKEYLQNLKHQSLYWKEKTNEKFDATELLGELDVILYVSADADKNDKVGFVSKYNEATKNTEYKKIGGVKETSKFSEDVDLENIIGIARVQNVSKLFIRAADFYLRNHKVGDFIDEGLIPTYDDFILAAKERRMMTRKSLETSYKKRFNNLMHLVIDKKKLDEFQVDRFEDGQRIY